jgi:hypothetical protein
MSNPGGEDRDSERQQWAALTPEGQQEAGSSTGTARGASRAGELELTLPGEWEEEDQEAWKQLEGKRLQEGSSTGNASGAFRGGESESTQGEEWELQDPATWGQSAQEGRPSASSDHQPRSEAPSRVEDALSGAMTVGRTWLAKKWNQAAGWLDGPGTGNLDWHSFLRRDRGAESGDLTQRFEARKRTAPKPRENPQPASSQGRTAPKPPEDVKGKGRAPDVQNWETVLKKAAEAEKKQRIADKVTERTESCEAEGKGKGRESDGNGGMSI